MERARAEKTIGSSLQAAPVVYLSAEKAALLSGLDFAELCIASALALRTEAAPQDAFVLSDVPGVAVVVSPASGVKCERCWQVKSDVNTESLCPRCASVVASMAKK